MLLSSGGRGSNHNVRLYFGHVFHGFFIFFLPLLPVKLARSFVYLMKAEFLANMRNGDLEKHRSKLQQL